MLIHLAVLENLVIRNAGGRAADAMRSIIALDNILGLGTVILIQHTGKILESSS